MGGSDRDLEAQDRLLNNNNSNNKPPPEADKSPYKGQDGSALKNHVLHLTSMGHQGGVNTVACSFGAIFIVTGGKDYTVRVWLFDERFDAYLLVAKFYVHPKAPASAQDKAGMAKVGITTVAISESTRAKDQHDKMRMGPIIAGTSSGTVYIIDILQKSMQPVEFPLHAGPVNSICCTPTYPGNCSGASGDDFLVVTGGQDNKACLLRMDVMEHMPPESEALVDSTGLSGGHWFFGGNVGDPRFRKGSRTEDRSSKQQASQALQYMNGDPNRPGMKKVGDNKIWLKLRQVEQIADRNLEHDAPVLSVCHVNDARDEFSPMWVTLTFKGAHLWSKQGRKLMTLQIKAESIPHSYPDINQTSVIPVAKYDGLATHISEEGGLIFVSGDKKVGVWSVDKHGVVGTRVPRERMGYTMDYAHAAWKTSVEKLRSVEPMVVYQQKNGAMIALDQGVDESLFAVQVTGKNSNVCTTWDIVACSKWKMSNPAGPMLKMPGKEENLLDCWHPKTVNAMLVGEEREEPCLITACNNGSTYVWDLEGPDKGQVTAELRSLGHYEIFMPPILMIVGWLQIATFAFGKHVAWPLSVYDFWHLVRQVLLLDFLGDSGSAGLFWGQIIFLCINIMIFNFIAFTGLIKKIDITMESDATDPEASGLDRFKARVLVSLKNVRMFLRHYMMVWSTILVAPLFYKLAQATQCHRPFGTPITDFLGNPNRKIFLAVSPETKCMTDSHLGLMFVFLFILPPFIWALIPHAACAGDAEYVTQQDLLSMKSEAWSQAAVRKATSMHRGFLHLVPSNAYTTLCAELTGKMLLPFAALNLRARPSLQILWVLVVTVGLYVCSLKYAPFLNNKFCCFVQDMKLWCVLIACCGVVAAHIGDRRSQVATGLIWLSTILVVVIYVIQFVNPLTKSREIRVRKFYASEAASSNSNNNTNNTAAPKAE